MRYREYGLPRVVTGCVELGENDVEDLCSGERGELVSGHERCKRATRRTTRRGSRNSARRGSGAINIDRGYPHVQKRASNAIKR